MTDIITSKSTDLSSWITLYLKTSLRKREEKIQICLLLTGLLKKIYARHRDDG